MNRHLSVRAGVCGLVLFFALSGCGSAQKNAAEKLENGEFDSAMQIYEKILKRDPKNLEAQEGLKRARGGVLANRLIDVRKARDSGNPDQALEVLLQVNQLEAQWNTFPPAAARFTQEEETNFAWKPFQSRIQAMVQAKQPLRAEGTYRKFSPVFQQQKHAAAFAALGPQIARAGRDHCGTLAKQASPSVPYYAEFVGRYCRYWKASAKLPANTTRARAAELFSGFHWTGKIEGMPSDYQAMVRSSIEESLRSSPWYDPAGAKKIPAQLDGSYEFQHQKALVTRVKSYQESEKYSVVEKVTKTRQVPFETQSYEKNAVTGAMELVKKSEIRTETYQEEVPVMKTRQTERQFPYSALFHQQNIQMGGVLIAQVGAAPVSLSESAKAAAEGDEQNLKNDAVGLQPTKPTLLDPANWVKGECQKWKGQFAEKLRAEWISQVCRSPESGAKPEEVADQILRCRREPSAGQLAFVNDWYARTFGMAQAEVEGLLPAGK